MLRAARTPIFDREVAAKDIVTSYPSVTIVIIRAIVKRPHGRFRKVPTSTGFC
eukprot:SAG11_NODE_32445_length_283_cov_1.157609_1_plen_52_part_01